MNISRVLVYVGNFTGLCATVNSHDNDDNELYLSGQIDVTDKYLVDYIDLESVESLDLSGTSVSEISLWVGRLKSIKVLDISNTNVKDISMLAELTNLEMLDISETDVNDISILAKLPQLHLFHTCVEDVKALSESS
jgi:Leucine-rich repeat (LRR) protein